MQQPFVGALQIPRKKSKKSGARKKGKLPDITHPFTSFTGPSTAISRLDSRPRLAWSLGGLRGDATPPLVPVDGPFFSSSFNPWSASGLPPFFRAATPPNSLLSSDCCGLFSPCAPSSPGKASVTCVGVCFECHLFVCSCAWKDEGMWCLSV
jgi:hypothetical protein